MEFHSPNIPATTETAAEPERLGDARDSHRSTLFDSDTAPAYTAVLGKSSPWR
jgi:hypothetical protein